MNYEIKRPLMKVIDKCLLDHAAAVGTKEGGPDIEDVYRLQNLSKIHYYLKEDHDFLADEVAALLQFTDPLTVALECWKEQDHPWEFPICDILYEIKAYERFPLVNPAGYAQQKVDQIQSLKDRLDQNMSDFQAELLGMDKMEIIAMSAEISAMQGAHNFMKKYFKFEPGNAEILLRMENPLKFVATQWRSDVAELFDMNAQVGEAIVEAGKEAAVLRYFAAPEQRQAIAGVFLPVQNSGHGGGTPVMRVHRGLNRAVYANAVKILAGGQYALRAQFLGDLSRPQAGHAHSENPLYYLCRWPVYQPLGLVLRVFFVAIRDISGERYSGVATALHDTANLIARIFRVPLIEQILHWNDVADAICGVDVVHDGDVPHVQPDKIFFQKLAYHKAVPAQPGVVFDHQICHKPLLGQLHDFHEGRPCERNPRVSVVEHKAGIRQVVVCGELL